MTQTLSFHLTWFLLFEQTQEQKSSLHHGSTGAVRASEGERERKKSQIYISSAFLDWQLCRFQTQKEIFKDIQEQRAVAQLVCQWHHHLWVAQQGWCFSHRAGVKRLWGESLRGVPQGPTHQSVSLSIYLSAQLNQYTFDQSCSFDLNFHFPFSDCNHSSHSCRFVMFCRKEGAAAVKHTETKVLESPKKDMRMAAEAQKNRQDKSLFGTRLHPSVWSHT